jgi:hypothetical protein
MLNQRARASDLLCDLKSRAVPQIRGVSARLARGIHFENTTHLQSIRRFWVQQGLHEIHKFRIAPLRHITPQLFHIELHYNYLT